MKYMITWHERSMGSAADYEGLQKRIMAVFKEWKIPESVKVHHWCEQTIGAARRDGRFCCHAQDEFHLSRISVSCRSGPGHSGCRGCPA